MEAAVVESRDAVVITGGFTRAVGAEVLLECDEVERCQWVRRVKEIGSTMSGRKGTDDSMTLQSQKFQIGDYLDIAITPPNRAPPPSGRMRPY
ncbi:hypothetical protein CB1_000273043 [Camelus ferus]|nr:hypothetical protein CB1_000273043 [Camelus ferus]